MSHRITVPSSRSVYYWLRCDQCGTKFVTRSSKKRQNDLMRHLGHTGLSAWTQMGLGK